MDWWSRSLLDGCPYTKQTSSRDCKKKYGFENKIPVLQSKVMPTKKVGHSILHKAVLKKRVAYKCHRRDKENGGLFAFLNAVEQNRKREKYWMRGEEYNWARWFHWEKHVRGPKQWEENGFWLLRKKEIPEQQEFEELLRRGKFDAKEWKVFPFGALEVVQLSVHSGTVFTYTSTIIWPSHRYFIKRRHRGKTCPG